MAKYGMIDVDISKNVTLDDTFTPLRQVMISLPYDFFNPPQNNPDVIQPWTEEEMARLIGRQVIVAIKQWVENKAKNKVA